MESSELHDLSDDADYAASQQQVILSLTESQISVINPIVNRYEFLHLPCEIVLLTRSVDFGVSGIGEHDAVRQREEKFIK